MKYSGSGLALAFYLPTLDALGCIKEITTWKSLPSLNSKYIVLLRPDVKDAMPIESGQMVFA